MIVLMMKQNEFIIPSLMIQDKEYFTIPKIGFVYTTSFPSFITFNFTFCTLPSSLWKDVSTIPWGHFVWQTLPSLDNTWYSVILGFVQHHIMRSYKKKKTGGRGRNTFPLSSKGILCQFFLLSLLHGLLSEWERWRDKMKGFSG